MRHLARSSSVLKAQRQTLRKRLRLYPRWKAQRARLVRRKNIKVMSRFKRGKGTTLSLMNRTGQPESQTHEGGIFYIVGLSSPTPTATTNLNLLALPCSDPYMRLQCVFSIPFYFPFIRLTPAHLHCVSVQVPTTTTSHGPSPPTGFDQILKRTINRPL